MQANGASKGSPWLTEISPMCLAQRVCSSRQAEATAGHGTDLGWTGKLLKHQPSTVQERPRSEVPEFSEVAGRPGPYSSQRSLCWKGCACHRLSASHLGRRTTVRPDAHILWGCAVGGVQDEVDSVVGSRRMLTICIYPRPWGRTLPQTSRNFARHSTEQHTPP